MSRSVLGLAACAEGLAWAATVLFSVATVLRAAIVPLVSDRRRGSSADRDALDQAASLEGAAANIFSFGWLAFLALVVLLMVLWFRILNHAKQLGAGLRFGPGWAVGAWFIPVANLVLVPLVASEVLQLALWRGGPPLGALWRRRFPLLVVIPSVAFAASFLSMSVAGSRNRDGFSVNTADQVAFALASGLWAVTTIASALVARRTRRQLAPGPFVMLHSARARGG
jgi:hypothetical protein